MRKGEKMSDEAKANLRKWHLGKKLSPEHREKVIKYLRGGWNKGIAGPRGEKHPMWKGGRHRYLAKQVIERDKGTCQRCGLIEAEIMDVDHIKPKVLFPELVFEIDNLMTLCPNCHRRKTTHEKKELKISALRHQQPTVISPNVVQR